MCDYEHNILIVGDLGVGKSSLFGRFLGDRFSRSYKRTVVIDIDMFQAEVAKKMMLLVVWDTSGDDSHHDTLRDFYADAHGVIIVYDTTSLYSFRNVRYWLRDVIKYCPKEVSIMLVGNKCDQEHRREVSVSKAARHAARYGLSFYETSAKSGTNVKAVFRALTLDIYNRLVPKIVSPSPTASMEVDDGDRPQAEEKPEEENQFDEYQVEEYQPEEYKPEGYQPEEYQPEEYQPEEYQPKKYQPQEYQPEEYHPGKYRPGKYQPEEYQPEEYQPEEYKPERYQPEEYHPEAYQPEEYQPEEYQPEEYLAEEYRPEKYRAYEE